MNDMNDSITGDMLLSMKLPKDALSAYEQGLAIEPNHFQGVAGAALAACLAEVCSILTPCIFFWYFFPRNKR